ncbi:hypothetical protein Tco_0864724, partial [Tanacetum coccineum]
HRFIMDDPSITMEEYIRLEEEKARRQGQTFDWQTARYGKMEYYENKDDSFTDLETEYSAIVFDDAFDTTLSREPTISPLNNNEIDFKISFDESDDKDYMVVFDENSFCYKIISVDNLKTDSDDENDKVDLPSSPSPEPTFSYIDDLDIFKYFEDEFPAILYNDLKSESDPLNEPSVSSKHIDKFETSLSEYEENILCLSDSFSYNPKTIKENDDNIDMTRLSGSNIDTKRSNELPETNHDKTDKVDGWYEADSGDRLSMVYAGDDEEALFTSHAWRRLFEVRAPLVREFILEFLSTCRMRDTEMGLDVADTLCLHSKEEMAEPGFGAYWAGSERVIPDKGGLRHYWIEILFDGEFLGPAPSYVHIRDSVRRLCHRMIACSISGLKGLSVVVSELLIIDLHELARLNIYARFGNTWAWVASGPERQQAAVAGSPGAVEDALAADEGAQAVPAPV